MMIALTAKGLDKIFKAALVLLLRVLFAVLALKLRESVLYERIMEMREQKHATEARNRSTRRNNKKWEMVSTHH